MNKIFNPPPNWPENAKATDLDAYPKAPVGWQLYPELDSAYFDSNQLEINTPVLRPEIVPATAAIPERPAQYPLIPVLPGVLKNNEEAKISLAPKQSNPFAKIISWSRRNFNLLAIILGILVIITTIVLFIWLYQFALTSLPEVEIVSLGSRFKHLLT